jgi:ABC-2 type transport system ATP-binding protein
VIKSEGAQPGLFEPAPLQREDSLIEVDHLTKSYGKNLAVNDISFSVAKGEILGFLGPNGAGKTTTMRILTGYLPATSGSARVADFDVFEQSAEVRRRMGYLPEAPPLYPDMNVRGYLEFVARIKGVPKSDIPVRVQRALELASVEDRRDELIKRLSRGYKQRVGIAQAIVHNPDVVILDEPTVGLDPKQIIEVRKLIKGLAGEHTIVLSTHILPEASQTCDRVVIINRGRIAAVDTPDNLIKQLKGAERVQMEVGGEEGSIREAIEKVEGVTKAEVNAIDSSNHFRLIVESEPGTDLRARLASAVIANGMELLELRAISLSLEDIFLQLTTEESSTAMEDRAASAGAAAAADDGDSPQPAARAAVAGTDETAEEAGDEASEEVQEEEARD